MGKRIHIGPTPPLWPESELPVIVPSITYKTSREIYQEEVKGFRRSIKENATKSLDTARGERGSEVIWICEPRSGLPKNVFRDFVYPRGWRWSTNTFEAPGHISNRETLREIAGRFASGAIRFEPVDPDLVELIVDYFEIDWAEACAACNHSLEIRDLRPLETRSHRLRKGTTNRTTQYAPEDPEDPIEDEWPEDVERAMRALVGNDIAYYGVGRRRAF